MPRPPSGTALELPRKAGRTYALRFRAYGERRYLTLGTAADGWTMQRAEQELANVLADVRRGIWQPPAAGPIVDLPEEVPTFHVFASGWVEARSHEVDARTVESYKWALTNHLLPTFAAYSLDSITPEIVDGYKLGKLRDRERLTGAIEAWRKKPAATRGRMPARPLNASSINKTMKIGAQIVDAAIEYGHVSSNPFRGKRRRVKESKPRRTWLELPEVKAILDAAGAHRALLATMILAGLRVGELTALRWRNVDLARARLNVTDAKTDAGVRTVDVTPMLLDELKAHKLSSRFCAPDDLVFCNGRGNHYERSNVRQRILGRAIDKANIQLAENEQPQIQAGITNHTLRRTFASLLYEAGASPAYVMSQMGHTSSALALEVYAKKMERSRDTGARMDALIQAADWALMGTSEPVPVTPLPRHRTGNAA